MAANALRRLIEERREDVQRVARAHGADRIRLIGSVARGDEHARSDVDFLVRFEKGRSLFDQAGLIHDLQRTRSRRSAPRPGDDRFVGVRIVPWLWDLPPNYRRYYPVYVAPASRPACPSAARSATPIR